MYRITDHFSERELLILNTGLSAAAYILLALILLSIIVDPAALRSRHGRSFFWCVFWESIMVMADLIERLTMYRPEHLTVFAISTYISYIAGGIFEIYAFGYLLAVIEEKKPVSRPLKLVIFSVCTAAAFIFVIPWIGPRVLEIHADASCRRGSWYLIRVIFNVVLTALTYILLISQRKQLIRRDRIVFGICFTLPIPLSIQGFWVDIPSIITMSFLLLMVYITTYQEHYKENLRQQKELAEQRAELMDAKSKLMLSQIQPHFLYNTLGSIAYLCGKAPDQAQGLTVNFSRYLRGNLNAMSDTRPVPFSKELEHVKTYLAIELVRFSDTLRVRYDIQAQNFELPVLTVEPLVENAVKHGICEKKDGGTVAIATRELPDAYQVIVSDDGVGFDTTLTVDEQEHMGIANARHRVETLCGGTLYITSAPGQGTIAVISLPKERTEA